MTRFIVLISLSQDNASVGKTVLANLAQKVDSTCRPQWVDSKGVGIMVSTTLTARDVWAAALAGLSTPQRETLRDMLVLEIGQQSLAWPESKAGAWLNSHRS